MSALQVVCEKCSFVCEEHVSQDAAGGCYDTHMWNHHYYRTADLLTEQQFEDVCNWIAGRMDSRDTISAGEVRSLSYKEYCAE